LNCKNCNKEFNHNKRNEFCSRSCATTYRNIYKHSDYKLCLNCNNPINFNKRNINKFCCQSCATKYRFKDYFYISKDELKSDLYGSTLRRKLFEIKPYKCEKCNNSEWLNELIVLEVHHIDGNSKNNKLNNLQLLCPNCHSTTNNYKNKNKGNGRKDRNKHALLV
jgi:HNH endonuclease